MQLGAPIVEIAARDGTIVALGGNGELRRLGPHGRAAHTHARADAIAIANTGTVYLAQATRLLAWDGGGEPELVATLPLPIISLRGVARDRIAIATADRALRLYDPATRDVRLVLPAAAELAIGDTVAAGALDGGIAAVDLVTGTRWTIAEHFAPVSGGLAISPDETALIAGDREALHRFALVLPDRAWAERATNAAPPRAARGAIEWRAMPASR